MKDWWGFTGKLRWFSNSHNQNHINFFMGIWLAIDPATPHAFQDPVVNMYSPPLFLTTFSAAYDYVSFFISLQTLLIQLSAVGRGCVYTYT